MNALDHLIALASNPNEPLSIQDLCEGKRTDFSKLEPIAEPAVSIRRISSSSYEGTVNGVAVSISYNKSAMSKTHRWMATFPGTATPNVYAGTLSALKQALGI